MTNLENIFKGFEEEEKAEKIEMEAKALEIKKGLATFISEIPASVKPSIKKVETHLVIGYFCVTFNNGNMIVVENAKELLNK